MSFWNKSNKTSKEGKDNRAFDESDQKNDTTHVVSIVIGDDGNSSAHRNKHKTPYKELVKFLSPLYAIVTVIIGFLFPLTEALKHDWLQTDYYAAYLTYMMSLSIVFLIYFVVYLVVKSSKFSKRRHSQIAEEENDLRSDKDKDVADNNNNNNDNDNNNKTADKTADETTRTNPPGPPVSDRKAKQGGGVTAKLKISKSCSSLSGATWPPPEREQHPGYTARFVPNGRRDHVTVNSGVEPGANGDVRKPKALNQYSTTLIGSMVNLNAAAAAADEESSFIEETWIDLSKIGNIFNHEGSSLYLRFATLLFGLCNIIYVGLEIQNTMVPKENCYNVMQFGWIFVIRLVFLVVQTFFLFKYPTVEIDGCESVARFGLMQIMATNVCLWLKTLVLEIMNEFDHLEDKHCQSNSTSSSHSNSNATSTQTECDYFTGVLKTLSPYLFPFVLEYSLIAMGTLATMYSSIVDDSSESKSIGRGIEHLFKIKVSGSPDDDEGEEGEEEDGGGKEEEGTTLRKSHRGLFLGVLVLGASLITTITFYATEDCVAKDVLYVSTDLAVHSLLLIATGAGLVQTNRLSYIAKPIMVDDVLLVLAMTGSLTYELSLVLSASFYITSHAGGAWDDAETVEVLQVCASLVAALQTFAQVVLVASGFRRYPSTRRDLDAMPGRESVTFLIVGNVVVWIARTMQTKQAPQQTELDYYDDITWLLLVNINLPLLLFFRFHSSICLADVWHSAYRPVDARLLQQKRTRVRGKVGGGGEGGRSTAAPDLVRSLSSSVANLDSSFRPDVGSGGGRVRVGLDRRPPPMLEGVDIVTEDGIVYENDADREFDRCSL